MFWTNFLNPKSPNPKDPDPNLGKGADPSGPHPSGATYSGFGVVVVMVVVVVVGLDFPGPPSAGPSLHWTPLRRTTKFRSFFPSSVSLFLCLKRRDPQMCTFRLSGCRVKPRRLRGRRGFTRQPENSKREHMRVLALQTPPKFHEKTPRETQKRAKWWREREKKRKILGSTPFGAPPFGAPPFGAPPFGAPRCGSHPFGPHSSGPNPWGPNFF